MRACKLQYIQSGDVMRACKLQYRSVTKFLSLVGAFGVAVQSG